MPPTCHPLPWPGWFELNPFLTVDDSVDDSVGDSVNDSWPVLAPPPLPTKHGQATPRSQLDDWAVDATGRGFSAPLHRKSWTAWSTQDAGVETRRTTTTTASGGSSPGPRGGAGGGPR